RRVMTMVRRLWLVLLILMGLAATPLSAQTPLYQRREVYSDYLLRYQGAPTPSHEVVLPLGSYVSTDMEVRLLQDAYGRSGPAIWTDERGYVEWVIDVPEAGLYNIELTYYPPEGRGTAIEREIQINGETLFQGADLLVFHRTFTDGGPTLRDLAGNEIRPRQVERPMWRTVYLSDSLGHYRRPYQFYFEAGENTIRLISLTEPMVIGDMRLTQAPVPKTYAQAKAEFDAAGLKP